MPQKTFVAALLLSGTLIVLFTALGLPPGHSAAFNYSWTVQYADAVSWSNPLPRYLPGLWAGFGGHDFFFYGPLPYWFIATLIAPICPGCAPTTEFALGSSLLLIASGASMFAFLRCLFAARAAAIGAGVYVLLPYHLLFDWFERQAAGEFTAYVFVPLVALGAERLRRNERGGQLLSLGVAGTALSHLPTTLLAGHVFVVLVLVFAAMAPGGLAAKVRLLARFVGYGSLGLALACFYWLPAILLLDTVSPDILFDPYFEAWRWLFGPGSATPDPNFSFRIAAAFVVCLPLILASLRYARGPVLAWILVPAGVAVILNTTLAEPIWRGWVISSVQFPWRMMTLVDFATGIAAGVLAAYAIDRTGRLLAASAFVVALFPAAFLAMTVTYSQSGSERSFPDWFAPTEYLSPEMTDTLRNRLGLAEISHFDKRLVVDAISSMASDFDETQGALEIVDRNPRSLTVRADDRAMILSLPVQYWELWVAETAHGHALEIRPNPVFGTIDVMAPADGFGDEPVTVSLPAQNSELLGAAVSLLAILTLIASSLMAGRGAFRREHA